MQIARRSAALVLLLGGLARLASAQGTACGGVLGTLAPPAVAPPQALWDQLQPVGAIWNTSNYDGNHTLNSSLPAASSVDIEGNVLLASYWAGFALFDLSGGPLPPLDPNTGKSAPLSIVDGWRGDFSPGLFGPPRNSEIDQFSYAIDAPEGDPSIFGLGGIEPNSTSIWDSSNPRAPRILFQDANSGDVQQVYSTTIAGQAYTFAASSKGTFIYNMTAARALGSACIWDRSTHGNANPGCGSVYVGKLGAYPSTYVHGFKYGGKTYVVRSSGGASANTNPAKMLEIFDVSNPAAPVPVTAQAFPGAYTTGVALWSANSSAYLAVRRPFIPRVQGASVAIFDLSSCLGSASCGSLASPIRTLSIPDSGSTNWESLTVSFSGARPMLFAGNFALCHAPDNSVPPTTQTEFLWDMSTPTAPVDVSPQNLVGGKNYWEWFYPTTSTVGAGGVSTGGAFQAAPRSGKFNGQYFYRADHTLLDVHKLVNSTPVAPIADFTWSPSVIFPGDAVNFIDATTGTVTSRAWTFLPDGAPAASTAISPAGVVFATAGTKTVSLQACNGPSLCNTRTQNVLVTNPAPSVANVTFAPPSPLVCQPVTFTANGVTGKPPLTYGWTVTGGDTGSGNPFTWTTVGKAAGQYTGSVTVHNGFGPDASASTVVTLGALGPLSFSGPPSNDPFAFGTVTFHANAQNATDWNWDFGDGLGFRGYGGALSVPNPTFTYSTTGTKIVRVKVKNCIAAEIASAALTIQITQTQPLLINGFVPEVICNFGVCSGTPANTPLVFDIDVSGGPDTFAFDWDGDGTFEVSGPAPSLICDPPPPQGTQHCRTTAQHTYTTAGIKNPVFKVQRGGESKQTTASVTITAAQPPSIAVSGPSSGTVGTAYSFSAQESSCTASPSGWTWTTGGGSGSSHSNSISITWSSTGTKNVTATNPGCPAATGLRSIAISSGGGGGGGGGTGGLVAKFTMSTNTPNTGQIVTFDGSTSVGGPTAYSWDFGDGQTANGTTPTTTHAFATAGTFTIKLDIAKPGSDCPFGFCSSSVSQQLSVQGGTPPLTASFTTNATCVEDFAGIRCNAATGQSVSFTSTTAGATSNTWTFGDGGTASGAQVTHTWTAPGAFAATLTASNGTSTSSASKAFLITGDPKPSGTLVLPWIAQVDTGRVQTSDLFLHNPGKLALDVDLTFYKRGTPEANPPKVTRTIAPGATLFVADVLKTLFNKTNLTGLVTLSVRSGDALPVMTSFNTTGPSSGPQFGQTVSAVLRTNTSSLAAAGAGAVQNLVGLSDDAKETAIFGVSNPTDGPATYRVSFFDASGQPIGKSTPAVTLSRFGLRQYQLAEVRSLFGVTAESNYRIRIETLSGGPLLPFGSNVRVGSDDPAFVDVGDTGRATSYLVGARNGGAWRTDLLLSNLSTDALESAIQFTPVGVTSSSTASVHVTLQPGETRRFEDVLKQQLGVDDAVGTLAVASAGANGVYPVVQAETYDNTNPARRFGQTTVAQGDRDAAGPGQGEYLVGLRQDAKFHSAFWINNPGTAQGTYDVIYRDLAGNQLGSTLRLNLQPGKSRAFQPGQHPLPPAGIANGFTVQVLVRSGRALAAAQVIFNATNDPAYVRGIVR